MGYDRLTAAARNVRVPTLLVRGAQSDIVSPEGAAELQNLIPGSRSVDVRGTGHMVAGDDNDVFTREVLNFLTALPPGCGQLTGRADAASGGPRVSGRGWGTHVGMAESASFVPAGADLDVIVLNLPA